MVSRPAISMLFMTTIGERILQARTAAGFQTQKDLADRCGVTRSAVSQWEAGTSENIKPQNLAAIAEACAVSMRWLATGKGAMEGLSREDEEWLAILRRARPRERQAIRALLDPGDQHDGNGSAAETPA